MSVSAFLTSQKYTNWFRNEGRGGQNGFLVFFFVLVQEAVLLCHLEMGWIAKETTAEAKQELAREQPQTVSGEGGAVPTAFGEGHSHQLWGATRHGLPPISTGTPRLRHPGLPVSRHSSACLLDDEDEDEEAALPLAQTPTASEYSACGPRPHRRKQQYVFVIRRWPSVYDHQIQWVWCGLSIVQFLRYASKRPWSSLPAAFS